MTKHLTKHFGSKRKELGTEELLQLEVVEKVEEEDGSQQWATKHKRD